MIVLVCGSRHWTNKRLIARTLKHLKEGDKVVHGAARGADSLAASYARWRGLEVAAYPADWRQYGRAAGPIRNQLMLDKEQPDIVYAFRCRGASRGTDDMIRRARKAGIPVVVVSDDGGVKRYE